MSGRGVRYISKKLSKFRFKFRVPLSNVCQAVLFSNLESHWMPIYINQDYRAKNLFWPSANIGASVPIQPQTYQSEGFVLQKHFFHSLHIKQTNKSSVFCETNNF